MKFCSNCGNKIEEGAEFCTSCGQPLSNTPPATTDQVNKEGETPEEHKAGNRIGILALILYFGPTVLTFITGALMGAIGEMNIYASKSFTPITTVLSSISGLAGLAGFVLMIVGRVKYPKNTLCKIVMWIFIAMIIIGIIGFILIIAFCYVACNSMSGCN